VKGVRKRAQRDDKKEAKSTNELHLHEVLVDKTDTVDTLGRPSLNRPKKETFAMKAKDFATGLMIVSKATFGFDLKNGGDGIEDPYKLGIRHFGDPYKLSKKLFTALRKGNGLSLYMKDFEPIFGDVLERVEAFKIFDCDDNG
jgi:hypothetical protein